MPSTINGIGTHYYGRKNEHFRQATCEMCGREGPLSTHETRLWFVIVFIPVIPLGKKQIIDYCAGCTGHKAVPLEEWQRASEESVQAAAAQSSAAPDDPRAGVELLATLDSFHRDAEATRLAELLATRFEGDAEVQSALGQWNLSHQRSPAAQACFRRALALDPAGEKPGGRTARLWVILLAIGEGDLVEARKQQAGFEGANRPEDAGTWAALGAAWQEAGQPQDALACFERALRAVPELAEDPEFFKVVRQAEAKLGASESLIPAEPAAVAGERSARLRRFALPVALVAGVLALLGGASAYIARGRTLHVVNATPLPARVSAGGESVAVAPGQRGQLRLPEGLHLLRVEQDGLPPAEVQARIESSFWTRLFRSPVFVLNVRGAGLLTWRRVHYRERGGGREAPEEEIHLGSEFLSWSDVDHPFEPPPREVRAKRSENPTRTVVEWHADVDAGALLSDPPAQIPHGKLLDYAEAHLTCAPGDPWLLAGYCALAGDQPARVVKFLEAGLARRPVEVAWHRAYQELCPDAAALRRTYDAALTATPDDAALLYLRGRLEERSADARAWFERALEKDPDQGWARWALAVHHAARGELEPARAQARRATNLLPGLPPVVELWRQLSFAAGELDELEGELRATLREHPEDLTSHTWLLEVLLERGQAPAAEAANRAWVAALPEEAAELGKAAEATLLALGGDFTKAEQAAAVIQVEGLRVRLTREARLMGGRVETLGPLLERADAEDLLEATLAHLIRGERSEAEALLAKARPALQAGTKAERAIAAVLAGEGELEDVVGNLHRQQVVAMVAAHLHPDRAAALLERVKPRFGRRFPRPLVEAAAAALPRRE